MAVELDGFVATLCQTQDFAGTDPQRLAALFADHSESLDLRITTGVVQEPTVRSGEPFTHLFLAQSGAVIAWQQPYSDLPLPFLVGIHELLLGTTRWVATYSATPGTTLIRIPTTTMDAVLAALPEVKQAMLNLALLRISRLYWTSFAIVGTPQARVAAALISRLAIRQEDFGRDAHVQVKQTQLVRLTSLSRTAVAKGLQLLVDSHLIQLGGRSGSSNYFGGEVLIPDVAKLKDAAFADVQTLIEDRFSTAAGS